MYWGLIYLFILQNTLRVLCIWPWICRENAPNPTFHSRSWSFLQQPLHTQSIGFACRVISLPSLPFTDELGSCMCFSSVIQHFPRQLCHLTGLCSMIRSCNHVMLFSKFLKGIVLGLWWSYGSVHISSSPSSIIWQDGPSSLPLKLDISMQCTLAN